VPSATFLENIGDDPPPAGLEPSGTDAAAPSPSGPVRDGSLGIGSLKGETHE